MILIGLRVHRIDLALTKGIVRARIHGRRRKPEPRRGHSIDRHEGGQPTELLIGRDVAELRQTFQAATNLVVQLFRFVRVRIFERVLVLGATQPVVDADVLNWLHVQGDALHSARKFGLQSTDHVGRAQAARCQRLQVDRDSSAIEA